MLCSITSGMDCLSHTCIRSELLHVGDHAEVRLTRFHFLLTVGPVASFFPQIVPLCPTLSSDSLISHWLHCEVKSLLSENICQCREGLARAQAGSPGKSEEKVKSGGQDLQAVMKLCDSGSREANSLDCPFTWRT